MTTEEAKEYLIKNTSYANDDFEKASEEDVAYGLAKEGEWVCNSIIPYPVNELEMKTAIELAEDHKFWNDPEIVNSYLNYMMG